MDFAWLDMEHAGFSIDTIYAAARASDAEDLPLLIRVGTDDDFTISSALDSGVTGVMVPHVSSAEDAARIVAAARYAPEGRRSVCPFMRAGRWMGSAGWNDYWPGANEQTVVGVLIENAEGLSNLEEIIQVPGIDLISIGGTDLSASLGLTARTDHSHPQIEQAKVDTVNLCKKYGKAALNTLVPDENRVDIEMFKKWYAAGFNVFTWPDVALYAEAVGGSVRRARLEAEEIEPS